MSKSVPNSPDTLPLHITSGFWNTPERPDNILPNFWQFSVQLSPGTILQAVEGGPHSKLYALFGTVPSATGSRAIPPPGNLHVFKPAREGGGLVKQYATGLETMSITDIVLRPSKGARTEQLLVVNSVGKCYLWSMESRGIIGELQVDQPPLSGTFSPDGELLAMGFSDGRVRVWGIHRQDDSTEAVLFDKVATVGVGNSREAQGWSLRFTTGGKALYMIKIAGNHTRARLNLQGQDVEILGAEDWATGVATSGGSASEVCFAGLGRSCVYYNSDSDETGKTTALAPPEATFAKHVNFVSAVEAVGAGQPPIIRPRGVVIACASRSVWLTDLKQSDHRTAKILAMTESDDQASQFHSVGLDGNTLWGVTTMSQS